MRKKAMDEQQKSERISSALNAFQIEIPSWGFANTGTRFGKFYQPAAATNLAEKFADAGQVRALTGVTPTLALHVEWDLPNGVEDVPLIQRLEQEHGVRAGSINPNLFQNQIYKYGSVCNPDSAVRAEAIDHALVSIEIGKQLHSRDVSVWLADGSNYPGSQSIRKRICWMQDAFITIHAALAPWQRMLIEYKPFEPAFYHTDIADWGMALELARGAGPRARVLVDTGHHYQSQNIEQIVTWLLHLNMLGGFHFNDRRYADDDLTLGSIDPYQVFRIFYQILSHEQTGDDLSTIAFAVDQSHNLKGKVEAVIQTVSIAQEIYARAALVDHQRLDELQHACRITEAEECFRNAFWEDVRPYVKAWRKSRGLPEEPLHALAESGYVDRISRERAEKNALTIASYV
jgi:L-rhamnose isomerase / sugar isomerase